MQIWFKLSDAGVEDVIYDSFRNMGLHFMSESVPDAATLLKFRHLFDEHGFGKILFDDIKTAPDDAGLIMYGRSIVDATCIAASSSTTNKKGERDPEMHRTRRGNQWYFGMKVHIGADDGTGCMHTVTATSANVHDVEEAAKLVRDQYSSV